MYSNYLVIYIENLHFTPFLISLSIMFSCVLSLIFTCPACFVLFCFFYQEPCLLSHIRIYNKSVLEWEIAAGLRYKVSFSLDFKFYSLYIALSEINKIAQFWYLSFI